MNMDMFAEGSKRAIKLLYLHEIGAINFFVHPTFGPIFELGRHLVRMLHVKAANGVFAIGFPPALSELVDEPWCGWMVQKGAIVLVGVAPKTQGTFQVRVPLRHDQVVRVLNRRGSTLHLGILVPIPNARACLDERHELPALPECEPSQAEVH